MEFQRADEAPLRALKSQVIKKHVLYFTVIALYLLLITALDIGCPSVFFLGIPCPACGSTRALLSLLRLDFAGYVDYHPFALPLGGAIWLLLHTKLFRRKRKMRALAYAVLVFNFLFYAWRFEALTEMVA